MSGRDQLLLLMAMTTKPIRWEDEEKSTNDVEQMRREFRRRLYRNDGYVNYHQKHTWGEDPLYPDDGGAVRIEIRKDIMTDGKGNPVEKDGA